MLVEVLCYGARVDHGVQHFPRPVRASLANVMLEIGKDLTDLFPLLANGTGDSFAPRRRIVRLAAAEVAEIGGDKDGCLEVVGFRNTQCCLIPAENVEGFVAKLSFVPKSDGDPQLLRHQR